MREVSCFSISAQSWTSSAVIWTSRITAGIIIQSSVGRSAWLSEEDSLSMLFYIWKLEVMSSKQVKQASHSLLKLVRSMLSSDEVHKCDICKWHVYMSESTESTSRFVFPFWSRFSAHSHLCLSRSIAQKRVWHQGLLWSPCLHGGHWVERLCH